MKRISASVLAIGLSGMAASVNAASDLSHCTDNSRECLIASAMSYINALTKSAPDDAMRMSPNIRRTVEGAKFPTGIAETTGEAAMKASPDPNDPEVKKYLAEHHLTFEEALAQDARDAKSRKYIIETIIADERAGQVVVVWGGVSPDGMMGKSMERFKIVKGLITEIESLDVDRKSDNNGLGWPAVQPCLKAGDGHLILCDQKK